MERKEFMMKRLPPGFRFHPTDEELVVQYLRRKAFSFPLPASIIPEIELGKLNPWDLPSGFGGEKYFFYLREERKCDGKQKTRVSSRDQILGYWKAMGKKKPVMAASRGGGNELVGTKQVMVFHSGKPPHGSKTEWIMHEYSLCNHELLMSSTQSSDISAKKEWTVCRIFAKRRSMKLEAGSRRRHEESRQIPVACPSSCSSSCLTNDPSDEDPVHGDDEATSKNIVA